MLANTEVFYHAVEESCFPSLVAGASRRVVAGPFVKWSKVKTVKKFVKRFLLGLPWRIGDPIIALWRRFQSTPKPAFSGWGMTTQSLPPWRNCPDLLSRQLLELQNEFKSQVKNGDFNWSQFSQVRDQEESADELLYRQYFVLSSVRMASQVEIGKSEFCLVEAGVCDGYSAWFALRAAEFLGHKANYVGYDSWLPMRGDELLPSESQLIGHYDYLDIKNVNENLSEFAGRVELCQGFIPNSFDSFPGPEVVHWLHIDLNSAKPTEATLRHFWERIPLGGVVLLDDYNWPNYVDTKILVDRFASEVGAWVLALPTGQGLLVKSK